MYIRESYANPDTLTSGSLERIDYSDAFFLATSPKNVSDVDTFCQRYFESQPVWLRLASMNTMSKKTLMHIIRTNGFVKGGQIGSWKIIDRNDREIVFGESFPLLTYRFGMRLERENEIYVSTVIKLRGRIGRIYFSCVKLVHKKFVRMTLKHTVKALQQGE